jgi:16S rRNA (cytidine1402-2'-O)-methyltransferase
MPGILYVVSTPIGHLADISYRAVCLLKEVAVIAAEDTRHTQKLTTTYEIQTPLTSYHDFNKEEKAPLLIARLLAGESVALVSDAGTPTLSDPGYFLINLAHRAGVRVSPVPGATAAIAALAASGLPTDRFVFEGFLPRKSGGRRARLEQIKAEPRTLIFYESPHRILALLSEMHEVLGDREIVFAREMTKVYEEIRRGRLSACIEMQKAKAGKIKGEITLVVEGYRGVKSGKEEGV